MTALKIVHIILCHFELDLKKIILNLIHDLSHFNLIGGFLNVA
jgi:hypothetical protein